MALGEPEGAAEGFRVRSARPNPHALLHILEAANGVV